MSTIDVDLYEPDGYIAAPPHEVLDELRRTDPVHWQDTPDGGGYWCVLKHEDVTHVAKEPTLFSASEGGVVIEDLDPESLASMRNMLLAMDPPRHTSYRRNMSPPFRLKVINDLEDDVRAITRRILDRAAEMGEVDFIHDVTAHLPSQVMGGIMGIPEGERAKIHRWAEIQTGGQDPDVVGEPLEGGLSASVHMAMWAMAFAQTRRELGPRGDITDMILASEPEGAPMTDAEFGSFFVQLVTAGNDTTRTMLSSGTHCLIEHPDQLALVRDDPSLVEGLVEEVLRWANPLHYFRRTATANTSLRGVPIAAGEKVVMMYTSANRDEDVFEDPHTFDITRDPNPHLSFGIAQHFCLGVHLARLEGRVFFEELLDRFGTIELAGEPVRQRSNLNNSLKRLPIRLAV